MERIAKNLVDFFIQHSVLSETDKVLYSYCFELLLIFVSNFFAIIFLSIVSGKFIETIFYLFGFWPLRMLAGGYHAKTPSRCFAMTLLFYIVFLLSCLFNKNIQSILVPFFLVFSIIVVFRFAPIDSPNKRFKDGQREKLQRKCRFTVIPLSMISLFGLHICYHFSYCLSFGMLVTALSLILSVINSRQEGGDNPCSQN